MCGGLEEFAGRVAERLLTDLGTERGRDLYYRRCSLGWLGRFLGESATTTTPIIII